VDDLQENINNPADVGRFLAGVGALIWDSLNDSYLVLKRAGSKDFAPGAWECVTGRVDQGESFEAALHREVDEELGIAVIPQFIIGTTHFYRGKQDPQNELLGIVYCCVPEDILTARNMIRLSQEHDECRWVTVEESKALLNSGNNTELWLQNVIERAEIIRQYMPFGLLATHLWQGFELDS
jgi:8-oxo-dGTP diphosphatase